MAVKHYVDEVVPEDGRVYDIADVGEHKSITDVTAYPQVGSSFGAADIEAACVLEAEHLKVGNEHRITIPNGDAENVKFIATADFAAGDTVTWNGDPMTVLTQAGEEPEAGLFKQGIPAECRREGSTLYVFCGAVSGSLRYDKAQTLTDTERARARSNLGVYSIAVEGTGLIFG